MNAEIETAELEKIKATIYGVVSQGTYERTCQLLGQNHVQEAFEAPKTPTKRSKTIRPETLVNLLCNLSPRFYKNAKELAALTGRATSTIISYMRHSEKEGLVEFESLPVKEESTQFRHRFRLTAKGEAFAESAREQLEF